MLISIAAAQDEPLQQTWQHAQHAEQPMRALLEARVPLSGAAEQLASSVASDCGLILWRDESPGMRAFKVVERRSLWEQCELDLPPPQPTGAPRA